MGDEVIRGAAVVIGAFVTMGDTVVVITGVSVTGAGVMG